MKKEYLGDSVYASFDGYSIRLSTSNGYVEDNIIFLDPQVFQALVSWAKKMGL